MIGPPSIQPARFNRAEVAVLLVARNDRLDAWKDLLPFKARWDLFEDEDVAQFSLRCEVCDTRKRWHRWRVVPAHVEVYGLRPAVILCEQEALTKLLYGRKLRHFIGAQKHRAKGLGDCCTHLAPLLRFDRPADMPPGYVAKPRR